MEERVNISNCGVPNNMPWGGGSTPGCNMSAPVCNPVCNRNCSPGCSMNCPTSCKPCKPDCDMDCKPSCNMDGNSGCMTQMSCEALLKRVYEAGFSMDDTVLYLDTHPCDKDALKYYHYVADMYRQAVAAYEAQCGPLMYDSVCSENYWTWVNGPWPWEGVCG